MVGSPHTETARHRAAFERWYEANRSFQEAAKSGKVSDRTYRHWAERFHWHARADARDQEAAKIADADAIARRAEMLKRHRQAGELLVRRGMEHHAKRAIEKAADATAAISKGIDIERTAEGLPTDALAILNAENLDALAAIKRRLLGPGEGEAPDADRVEGAGVTEGAAEGASS